MRPPSLKAADFQKALGSRPVSRTPHFVLHVLPRQVAAAVPVADTNVEQATELSTGAGARDDVLVDDFVADFPQAGRQAWRLGLVLPKKQARRSVTRSLIRHQAREALRRHAPAVWERGQYGTEIDGWVVRLRAPFDRQQFPSAASDALKALVRQELDELWARLAGAPASAGGRLAKDSPPGAASKPRGGA